MTPQNKLYEAAKKARTRLGQLKVRTTGTKTVILDMDDYQVVMDVYSYLDQIISAYEQEQPEAIAGENENGHLGKNTSIFSDKIYDSISSQQTSAKDKEISELEDALLDIIQVNEWKEKYGEDERYLQALPVALKNAKKLIQKQYESKDI